MTKQTRVANHAVQARIIRVLADHKGQELLEFSVNCITRGKTCKILLPAQYAKRKIQEKGSICNLSQFVHYQGSNES